LYLPFTLTVSRIVSFFIIFLLTTAFIYVILKLLYKVMAGLRFGLIDTLLGAIVGGFKGSLIVCLIVLLLNVFPATQKWISESRFAPYFVEELHVLKRLLPQNLDTIFHYEGNKAADLLWVLKSWV